MKQGIVIVTWSGGKPQLDLLLYSLRGYRKYPFYIVYNDATNAPVSQIMELEKEYNLLMTREDSFECGALQGILDNTDLDEFILLQDTFEILNPKFFGEIFNNSPEMSVTFGPTFSFFFGKFRREALLKVKIPITLNKHDAITAELNFPREYVKNEPFRIFDEKFIPIVSDDNLEMRWGRVNLITKNDYVIKRQGTWLT